MKIVTWEIGVEKPAGNFIQDGLLHHNQPYSIQIGYEGGINLERVQNYDYWPDKDSTGTYSDTLGTIDFTAIGGLVNGTKITFTWLQ